MASPWKHPKSGIYYFRRVVPEDLRPIIGKRELKTSLKTRDPHTAKSMFIVEAAKAEGEFQRARVRLQKATKVLSSLQEVKALAQHWENRASYALYENPDEVYAYLSVQGDAEDHITTLDLLAEISYSREAHLNSILKLLSPVVDEVLLEVEYQRPEPDSIIHKHLLTASEKTFRWLNQGVCKPLHKLQNLPYKPNVGKHSDGSKGRPKDFPRGSARLQVISTAYAEHCSYYVQNTSDRSST